MFGQQPDFKQIKKIYGEDLANQLKFRSNFATRTDSSFQIKLLEDIDEKLDRPEGSVAIAFITECYAYIYEFDLTKKCIVFSNFVSYGQCKQVFESMESLNEVKIYDI